jgi:serine/threonine protein kinase
VKPEIEEIFLEALDLLDEERDDFLDQACRDRPDLRAEVNRLLVCAAKAEEFFGEASTVMGHLAQRHHSGIEKLGDQIGNYKLVERLGEGGFGVVWRGSQTHPIKREVAIKVIKAGMDTREVLARFKGEREALSRMDHPNIARVLDAGETESGRPYVVMELVRGEAVTKFCDEEALPLRERLTLFLEICRALSHAHQKGVIHRDIKPSNVLVTSQGHTVKVIDFGIAKAIEGRLTDKTMMTLGEQLMGTPTYMSPEQAGYRVDLDTRTDIYALGTLLYELMVGVTPFDQKIFSKKGQEGMRQMILEAEPSRPSVRYSALNPQEQQQIAKSRDTTPEHLKHFVSSDLDWVVMRALEKTPDRRYATADALAADIENFLNHEPVSARPPSKGYLISKFVRRNRSAVLITIVVASVLIAATSMSLWQAFRATKAEGRANTLLRDSLAVSSLLTDVFRLPDPEANGRNITLAEALKSAARKIDQMEGLQPERKALLQSALAQSYEGLGLYPEATELLKKALKTDEAALGPLDLTTLEVQGHLAKILFDCGYYGDAWELSRSELERRKKAGDVNDANIQRAQKLMEESAIRSGKQPRPESPPLPSPPSTSPEQPGDVSKQHETIRRLLEDKERHLVDLRKTRPPDDKEVLESLDELANAYELQVYRNDAARVQSELVDLIRAKYGETHHLTLKSEETLVYYLWRAGQGKASEELQQKVIEKQQKVYGSEHLGVLKTEAMMIQELYFSGNTKGCVKLSREVIPLLEKVAGPNDRSTLNAKSFLARSLMTDGQTKEALEVLEEIAPLMSDDTYVNLTLANLEVWFGQNDRYDRTRRRMLDFCIKRRDRMISRPDILERALLICTLAPVVEEKEKKELIKTLDRCHEIRMANNAPKIMEPEKEWREFVAGLVYFRAEDYAKAAAAFLSAQNKNQTTQKRIAEAPLAAIFESECLRKLGEKEKDQTPLYAAAKEQIGTPASQQEPTLGRRTSDSSPLTRWNLLKQMEVSLKNL